MTAVSLDFDFSQKEGVAVVLLTLKLLKGDLLYSFPAFQHFYFGIALEQPCLIHSFKKVFNHL